MEVYDGCIQPNLIIVSAERDTTSNNGHINDYIISKNGVILRKRKGSIINYMIPQKGTITRLRKGINTKDFHIVPFKRIPRERVLNKYAGKNIKI
ncbi:hypothetical protein LAV60_07320 [Clostridium sporogenes]|uniref:Uncharacterized protein n=2 Tax=Clostridium TaxID=1485 RepID=A0A0D1BWP1_CLOBO|nr:MULTISPECIES: hypothetical protein [Clostridium]MBE6078708.1 hypothetical protein [Clostridium lundense]MDU2832715.1 hypothetical protein [Clostridium botulinum]KIS24805.1 hypothetical protein N495_14915 [Clostridium botulinum B2 450]MCW6092984.1 hypothetical protein [Clostridium sporogenes]MCW7999882.1 hypothetical protein [Clostridium sp. cpc1]